MDSVSSQRAPARIGPVTDKAVRSPLAGWWWESYVAHLADLGYDLAGGSVAKGEGRDPTTAPAGGDDPL
jgi:hypothetical protein